MIAHGFAVLSEHALFAYKCDNRYSPAHERGIAFNDPELAIDWHMDIANAILSNKDKQNVPLSRAELFDYSQKDYPL